MSQNGLIRTIEIKDRSGRVVGTKEVVTYQGLLSKAHDEGLQRIATRLVQIPSDENGRTAIAKALVETKKGRFDGIGDANPENVNSFIVPHLIRMAETRAKARALRDAVNIGIVSFEELDGDGFPPGESDLGSGAPPAPARAARGNGRTAPRTPQPGGNGNGTGNAGNGALMTEAQRRYLFRILAGQGLQQDAAHEYLKEFFGVEALSQVSKARATEAIDQLLQEAPDGAPQR
jgi:hypothetical protein